MRPTRVIYWLMLFAVVAAWWTEAVAETPRRRIRQTSATFAEPEFSANEDEPSTARDPEPRIERRSRTVALKNAEPEYVPEESDWLPRFESHAERPDDLGRAANDSPADVYFPYNPEAYEFQVLPPGLMFQSYLAGPKEPRFNAVWLRDRNGKLNWETQLGGRVGILRYGSRGVIFPQGWQLDLEGAGQTRVLPEDGSDLESVDYRFGILSTWRNGPWAVKVGYYHISSHLGDEFLIKNPGYPRLNYVRDSAIAGVSYDLLIWNRPDVRLYGEVGYAFGHEDGAEPLEFQFGSEYSPFVFNGIKGMPFAAVNGHAREDHDWSTGYNVVAGWQWRGEDTNHRFRIGLQYYNGPSLQFSFSGVNETVFGWGLWFDY